MLQWPISLRPVLCRSKRRRSKARQERTDVSLGLRTEPKRKTKLLTMASNRARAKSSWQEHLSGWIVKVSLAHVSDELFGTLKTSILLAVVFAAPCCNKPPSNAERHAAQSHSPATIVSATSPATRFGEEAKNPFFRMRLLNSKRCAVEAHLESSPGLRKVAVEVELQAAGTQEIPANPFYALLTDRDGRQFESTLAGCPPLLPAARLRSGESARGWITFDVPEGSEPHSLVYQPAVIGVDPPRAELLLDP
jgi:hypothetical protein